MRPQHLMRRLRAVLLMPALLVLAACGGQGADSADAAAGGRQAVEKVTVAHAQGNTDVPKNPQKVVVFDVGVLTLDELGVKVAGVPAVENLRPPRQVRGRRVRQGRLAVRADYEKVNALEPDLIIVAAAPPPYGELADRPTVDLSVTATSSEASGGARGDRHHLRQGGRGQQRLDAIEAAVQEAKAKADDRTADRAHQWRQDERLRPGPRFGPSTT